METALAVGTFLKAAAPVVAGISSGVSLIRSIATKPPKPPAIDYKSHNAAVDRANEGAAQQQRLLDQETARMTAEQNQAQWSMAQSEADSERARQNDLLNLELKANSDAREQHVRALELESSAIERALRKEAERETEAQERKTRNKKVAMLTGQRGRRSLLTSTALGYRRPIGL